MRLVFFLVLSILSGCSSSGRDNPVVINAAPAVLPAEYAVAAPVDLLIEDGTALRCNSTDDQTKKAGVLSAGLSCTDDRTGTVSFRHLPGDQVGSGFFVLNDGTKGHIIFVSKDGKSFKGKLEPPRRRPEFFIPPTG